MPTPVPPLLSTPAAANPLLSRDAEGPKLGTQAIPLLAAGGALLVGAVLGGVLLFNGESPPSEGTPSAIVALPDPDSLIGPNGAAELDIPSSLAFDDALSEVDDSNALPAGVNDGTGGSATSQDAGGATVDVEQPAPPPEPEPAEPVAASSGNRRAVLAGGIVYLSGRVPSVEIATAIADRVAAVMGPDNVVNEYIIDPSVTFDPHEGAPLYIEELVLFETASTDIGPQFLPLLDLGIVLMTQNPSVTITVIGHTDATGDDATNLLLSQDRVQAVLAYWVAAGIDQGRITAIGLGESAPLADNATLEGRTVNRRVEFIITGLLAD